MKRLPFLVSLALIDIMFCVYKGRFPVSRNFCLCKWYRGNVWKVVRERKKLNSLNFYVYAQTFIHSLYFIYECKINALTHVKIRWRWKPTLSCLSPTGHCLPLIGENTKPEITHVFSEWYLSLFELWRMAVERDWQISYVSNFFSSSKSLVDESRLIFMAQNANIFIIGPLCSIYKAVQGKFFMS